MARQKPFARVGLETGFPYQLLWEELEPDWEDFSFTQRDMVWIAARFEAARALKAAPHLCLRTKDIDAHLEPLELTVDTRKLLSHQLYWLAGAFLNREFGKLLNTGQSETRGQLECISKAAKAVNSALALASPETLALLKMLRAFTPNAVKPDDNFNSLALLEIMQDLALTADLILADLPPMARGRSIDTLRARWIWSATRAVESATGALVRAPQSDATGRNPRLEGAEATVLFKYLRLVSPGIKLGTVVRVIAERRREAKDLPAR